MRVCRIRVLVRPGRRRRRIIGRRWGGVRVRGSVGGGGVGRLRRGRVAGDDRLRLDVHGRRDDLCGGEKPIVGIWESEEAA